MNIAMIAMAAVIVIALLGLACALCSAVFQRKTSKRQKGPAGKVFVRKGVDVKKQMSSDGKGEYFSGGREEQPTRLVDPVRTVCRIRLDNIHTGETLYAEFISRLWIGRGGDGGTGGGYTGNGYAGGREMLGLRGDGKISRRHCMISRKGAGLYLQDMNSSNHTYLNGQRVTGTQALKNGDIIRMGDTEVRVSYTV